MRSDGVTQYNYPDGTTVSVYRSGETRVSFQEKDGMRVSANYTASEQLESVELYSPSLGSVQLYPPPTPRPLELQIGIGLEGVYLVLRPLHLVGADVGER